MESIFDQTVDRSGSITWLKDLFTPEAVKEARLLGFAGAEFEFPTCPAIGKGIRDMLDKGIVGFTLPNDAYRSSVLWWMEQVRGCRISADWILPTHGTIFSLATAIRLATEPGERIIILTPGYHRYEQAATRLGRGTVRVGLKEERGRYFLDWEALEAAMAQPENRLLVLTNPNNPTGTVFTVAEMETIAALARKYQVLVYSDEIFADVVFGGKTVTPYAWVAGEEDLAISCTALGKTFSLTGINHANVIIKNPRLRGRFQEQRNADHYGSLDPFHHAALTAAYSPEGKAWLEEMKAYVWENYEILRRFLNEHIPEAVVTEPEGTFVVWVDYGATGMDAGQLEQLLCREGLFVGDPGSEFCGRDTCFRYSLAVPRRELLRALERLAEALLSR